MGTKIRWTDETWNPVVGCTKVSEGCQNCYAEKMAFRLANMKKCKYREVVYGYDPKYDKKAGKWNGKTYCDESALDKPLHWKKPRRIFVCSMGDLFHESVPFEFIGKVMSVAAKHIGRTHHLPKQSVFQFLTKRPERMLEFSKWASPNGTPFPDNFWLGVTAENQKEADKRIPILLQIPAAKRFVSVEPLLSKINIKKYLTNIPFGVECDYEHTNKPQTGGRKTDKSGLGRRTSDRLPRPDMEIIGEAGESMESRNDSLAKNKETPSREKDGDKRLFGNPSDVELQTGIGICTSTGMEILQRENTIGDDHQSQKRNQKRQPSGKLGIDDIQRASDSSNLCVEENAAIPKSTRRKQSTSKADRCTSEDYPASAGKGRNAQVNRSRLQCNIPNDKQNSQKRIKGISWCIIGCESGPKRRPCKIEWVRDLVNQCKAAGVAPFVKQLEMWRDNDSPILYETEEKARGYCGPKYKVKSVVVKDINLFPEDLQYQEMPE